MTPRLAALDRADAALERTRLLGSPVAPGLADLVLRMEAERARAGARPPARGAVRRACSSSKARRALARLPIRGVVDRIDLLADGTLRVIDYKSSLPPAAMQLAIYAVTAAQRLRGHLGRQWTVGEAAYIIFNGSRVKSIGRNAEGRAQVLSEAQARFIAAADGIQAGVLSAAPGAAAPVQLVRVCRRVPEGLCRAPRGRRHHACRLRIRPHRRRRSARRRRPRGRRGSHAQRRARGLGGNRQDPRARGPLHEPAEGRAWIPPTSWRSPSRARRPRRCVSASCRTCKAPLPPARSTRLAGATCATGWVTSRSARSMRSVCRCSVSSRSKPTSTPASRWPTRQRSSVSSTRGSIVLCACAAALRRPIRRWRCSSRSSVSRGCGPASPCCSTGGSSRTMRCAVFSSTARAM